MYVDFKRNKIVNGNFIQKINSVIKYPSRINYSFKIYHILLLLVTPSLLILPVSEKKKSTFKAIAFSFHFFFLSFKPKLALHTFSLELVDV